MSHYFEFISFKMFLILGYTWCTCYLAVLCILLVTFLGYLLGKFRVLYIEKAKSWKCEKVADCYCCLCIGLIYLFPKFWISLRKYLQCSKFIKWCSPCKSLLFMWKTKGNLYRMVNIYIVLNISPWQVAVTCTNFRKWVIE